MSRTAVVIPTYPLGLVPRGPQCGFHVLGIGAAEAGALSVGDHVRERELGRAPPSPAAFKKAVEADPAVTARLLEGDDTSLQQVPPAWYG